MGDLQSEECRDVVVELTIDALTAPQIDPAQHLFDARCDCFNVISKQLESKSFKLTVLRPGKMLGLSFFQKRLIYKNSSCNFSKRGRNRRDSSI